jgi:hypothetical protein
MPIYHVSYDLHEDTSSDYKTLSDKLKTFTESHALQSSWLVQFDGTAAELAERLNPFLHLRVDADDPSDFIIVSEVTGNFNAWLPGRVMAWVKRHIR